VPAHLNTMDERRAAANRGRDVDGFRHLVEIGALLERIPAVRVDAVRTLNRMIDFSRADKAPSANTEPYQSKNFAARSGTFLPISGNRARSSSL
jgi:hypothetical protein